MTLAITGSYAAALTLFYLLLSARVIAKRRGHRINLGDGDDPDMLRRMRAHGNFAEYAPLGLLLLAIAELQGEAALWLHLTGGLLLAGRLMHGVNFTFALKSMPLRTGGMVLTFLSLLLGAGLSLPI
ncbi:MAG: MAPEG family protein [Rhodobacteraceae bacterium]|nr:MAPEG family protein [Paracoccaceae bacterium]